MNGDHDAMYDSTHSNDENCEDDEECCPCFPDKNVQKSLDNMVLQYPVVKQKEYCRILKKDYNVFNDYVNKCDSKGMKYILSTVSDAVRIYLKRGCNGHISHEPTCDKAYKAQSAAQKCMDRFVNAVYYIMKNIPAKDQISLFCCIHEYRGQCITDSYNKYCNKKYANYMLDRYRSVGVFYVARICPRETQKVCKNYPEAMKELIEINKSSTTTGRSLMYVWHQSHLNNLQALSYCYE